MMHLDAIVKRNRRPERQPRAYETIGFIAASAAARYDRAKLRAIHAARPVYVREV